MKCDTPERSALTNIMVLDHNRFRVPGTAWGGGGYGKGLGGECVDLFPPNLCEPA
jgi:hypothetical protein